MSRIPLEKLVRITDGISALYQLGIISSEERNELARCLKDGKEGLETLYLRTLSLPASENEIVCSIRETIIFN